MTKRTLFLKDADRDHQNIVLDKEKTGHYARVLRMKDGEEVFVTNGAGGLFSAVFKVSGKQAQVEIQNKIRQENRSKEIVLQLAMPKNTTMDWVVEKATEMGVSRIVPIVSSRTVVRPDTSELEKYIDRWKSISEGAIEQSERLWEVEIEPPVLWPKFCKDQAGGVQGSARFVFLSETRSQSKGDQDLVFCVESMKNAIKNSQGPLCLLLGPEGGFSDQEASEVLKSGYRALSLGQSVLRVETAVIVALTLARMSVCVG